MEGQIALLFSRVATLHASRSGLPDAPVVRAVPSRRERRAVRVRARAEAKAVRSAEQVVRSAARSARGPSRVPPRQAGTAPADPRAMWW
jgi:hypothetical protein